MFNLPVITAIGGISPAGRSSGNHAYRRLIWQYLDTRRQQCTLTSLASLSGRLRYTGSSWQDGLADDVDLADWLRQHQQDLLTGTLVRRLETNLFDSQRLLSLRRATIDNPDGDMLEFELRRKQLPEPLPVGWTVIEDDATSASVRIRAHQHFEVMLPSYHSSGVSSAGQLPTGFDPSAWYPARSHPRALQMTVYGASDAINSLGIDWESIRQQVAPDQISVLAGSGMGQQDGNGYGGMLQARLLGKKVTSKQLPLGYAEMPADFINAYLLGNLGSTGTNVAACATFLYNLRQAARDIQTGTHRLALVGTSEAPLTPEILEGFANMGALADDDGLRRLDGLGADQHPDHRRACRPFGENTGFTLAESAQFVVLMDDRLALELGANILGAVNEVYINADGHKKSIASPGLGNYLSLAKAAAATRSVIGDDGLRRRSYVHAHGTGTPQNRVTESDILSRVAGAFGIPGWPVTAVKAHLGHSLASAAGDQLMAALGAWSEHCIAGIDTIAETAADVSRDNLDYLFQPREIEADAMEAVLINSKGFGGNNASASILSPAITRRMLEKRHGQAAMKAAVRRNEAVAESCRVYDESANRGDNHTIYRFDHNVLGSDDLDMDQLQLKIRDIANPVTLPLTSAYQDMLDENE
jgi:acetoacetyl-[acyl-carrier protein] synthase